MNKAKCLTVVTSWSCVYVHVGEMYRKCGGTATIRNIVLATSNSETLKPANTSFKANVTYTLTYIVDGAEFKSFDVVYGTAITPEAAPTKEGHTFSGWSEIPATMPNHDVEVKGSFSIHNDDVKFSLIQKWLYQRKKIYVHKIIVRKFFEAVFVPKRAAWNHNGTRRAAYAHCRMRQDFLAEKRGLNF